MRIDCVLDYTSPLADVIMEYESGDSSLTYCNTYGVHNPYRFINPLRRAATAIPPEPRPDPDSHYEILSPTIVYERYV